VSVDLGTILLYEDKLVEVVAFSENQGRNLLLRPVNATPCSSCGSLGDIHILERSPLFQENAKPVKTLEEKTGERSA
jgi:hypothetical protein